MARREIPCGTVSFLFQLTLLDHVSALGHIPGMPCLVYVPPLSNRHQRHESNLWLKEQMGALG